MVGLAGCMEVVDDDDLLDVDGWAAEHTGCGTDIGLRLPPSVVLTGAGKTRSGRPTA